MRLGTTLPAVCLMVATIALGGCGGDDDTDTTNAPAETTEQAPAGGDEGVAELQDYELSMEDLNQWADANRALQDLAEQKPEIAAAMGEGDDSEMSMEESLDATEERIERVPEVREAVESAGISAREYGLITYAMLQAGMAQYAVEQGADLDSLARELEMNPDNIRFMQEHKDEIEQLTAELQMQNEE